MSNRESYNSTPEDSSDQQGTGWEELANNIPESDSEPPSPEPPDDSKVLFELYGDDTKKTLVELPGSEPNEYEQKVILAGCPVAIEEAKKENPNISRNELHDRLIRYLGHLLNVPPLKAKNELKPGDAQPTFEQSLRLEELYILATGDNEPLLEPDPEPPMDDEIELPPMDNAIELPPMENEIERPPMGDETEPPEPMETERPPMDDEIEQQM